VTQDFDRQNNHHTALTVHFALGGYFHVWWFKYPSDLSGKFGVSDDRNSLSSQWTFIHFPFSFNNGQDTLLRF